MKKKVLLVLLALPLLLVLVLAVALFPGHRQIRQVEPAMPPWSEIAAALQGSAGPSDIHYVNTATQSGPSGTIGHLGVLLQWPDGRRSLIDAGMAPAVAVEFGKLMEAVLVVLGMGLMPLGAYRSYLLQRPSGRRPNCTTCRI